MSHDPNRLGPGATIPPGWKLVNQIELLELIDDEGNPNLAYVGHSLEHGHVPVMHAFGMLELAKEAALSAWEDKDDD